jgi:vitamin B12 transporter
MTFSKFFRARLALAGVAVLAAVAANAQTPAQLPVVVTAATRTPAEPMTLGSAVERIDAAELARWQTNSLASALGLATGAPTARTGAGGAVTSLFLRGANSNQALFLVDGLRLNDPNTDYAVLLGGACLGACDSLEIAHGPQSTLYGGEAAGGVVLLRAERGSGAPAGRVSLEGGSFGTWQGGVAAQGERGSSAWSFSAQGGVTENARPNNAFHSANSVLRLDRTLSARVSVGATARWFHGRYGDPGDRYTNDPDNSEREDNVLTTAFAELKTAPDWTARVQLGGQDRRFVAEVPRLGRVTQITVVKNRRGVLDGQTSFTGWTGHRVTGGLSAEANHTRNTGFGDINREQSLLALFVQDEFSPRRDWFFTAGLRSDDFDTFGRATTGRATAAWQVVPGTLKLRSSLGTAFRSPSFLDLYGRSAFYAGNPNLRPERARGWDSGLDWQLAGTAGLVSLTWFDTDFHDLIASTPDFRSVYNLQRARTRGLEAAWRGRVAGWDLRAGATSLEATNLTAHTRLLRRPRLRGDLQVMRAWQDRFEFGAGLSAVAQREDVDARTYRVIDGEDYVVARVHAAWRLSAAVTLRVRCENLLNERYEDVNGYPALGRGVFASLERRF